jgi:hypothetical protein
MEASSSTSDHATTPRPAFTHTLPFSSDLWQHLLDSTQNLRTKDPMSIIGKVLRRVFGPPDLEKMKAEEDFEGLLRERASSQLVSFLGDPDMKVRHRALDALSQLGDQDTVEPIFHLLEEVDFKMDPSLSVRKKAAGLLESLGWQPESDKQKILYYLAKGEVEPISGLGGGVMPLLIMAFEKRLLGPNRFCDIVAKFDKVDAIQPLIDLLKWAVKTGNRDPGVRATLTLIRIGEPVVEPMNRALEAAVKSGDNAFADGGALTVLHNIARRRDSPSQA